MRKGVCLALLLVLFLSACGPGKTEQPEDGLALWFRGDTEVNHGPALAKQPYEGEAEPEALLAALLAGPTREGCVSPFPRGVSLIRCQWNEELPGTLTVDLSEQYGALADVSLTLADYCIVLTLSQVEGVESVEIKSAGHSISYRSHQLLSAEEAVLWDDLAEETT